MPDENEPREFEFQFLFGKVGDLSVHVDVHAATVAEAVAAINGEPFEDRMSAGGPAIAGVCVGIPQATEANTDLIYGPLGAVADPVKALNAIIAAFQPLAAHRPPKPTVSDAWRKLFDLGRVELPTAEKLEALETYIEERGLAADFADWLPDEAEKMGYDLDEYRREYRRESE